MPARSEKRSRTFWANFNVNRQKSNSSFTGTITARGSDGSTISYHEVSHFTMLPDGDVAPSHVSHGVFVVSGY